jgi:hypothetical protein
MSLISHSVKVAPSLHCSIAVLIVGDIANERDASGCLLLLLARG